MGQEMLVAKKRTGGRKSTKLRQLSVLDKEKIYQQHLGLVVDIAKRYIGISPDFSFENLITLGDLIDEGILGLFAAAERFDEQRGCKFSTYAVWWIKQFIKRALYEQRRTIHIPGHIIQGLSKYTRVRQKLWQELNREPLIGEMAAAMKITTNRARQIRKFLESPPKIISLTKLSKKDSNLPESIEDPKAISPIVLASRNIFKEDLGKTISESLTPREEKIIKMRFGLEGREYSLKEIGREMGLSRERIRQIIRDALVRLRGNEERKLKKE